MTPDAVLKVLGRRGGQAGISAHFTPHDLQRSFAGEMMDAGADVAVVKALIPYRTTAARVVRLRPSWVRRMT